MGLPLVNKEGPVRVVRKVVKAAREEGARLAAPAAGKASRAVPAKVFLVKAAADLAAKVVPVGRADLADNAR